MDIVILPTADLANRLASEIIADAVRADPAIVLGLATGRTMEPVYATLSDKHRDDGLSFASASTFNLDEYVGLSPDAPESFRSYMRTNFFDHVDLDPAQCRLPDGAADDLLQACDAYEQWISDAGGIGLQTLGIGLTGHIGFNEPGSSLRSRTRPKALSETTRRQNAEMFGGIENVPERAVTMGIGTILDARACLLLATGASKSGVVAQAIEGPISASMPASALQFHADCTVILDETAASDLENTRYYRTTFEKEPEWARYRAFLGL